MTNDVLVVTGGYPWITSLIMGPVSTTGLVEIIKDKDMNGSYGHYDHHLVERDEKLAKLYSRLSLAERSRNKMEITRLTREIKILGQGW